MTPEEKDEVRRRALANFAKQVPLDERKARKQRAKERRARRGGGGRRRERFDDPSSWEDVDEPERGRGGRGAAPVDRRAMDGSGGERPAAPSPPDSVEVTVEGIARDGARVEVGGRLLRVPLAPGADVAVGDRLEVQPLDDRLARWVGRRPRRSELVRADPSVPGRRRVLAANVDLGLVVLSVVAPPFKPGLFDRFEVALRAGGIEPRLVVNKLDLLDPAGRAELESQLAGREAAGTVVHRVSVAGGLGLEALRADVAGRVIVAVGHSGVGKSSLLNALDPDGDARATSHVRASDGKGRHTTTAGELRRLGDGTVLIDTPGIRALGLGREQLAALDAAYPEIAERAARCRFRNCRHGREPDCAVRAALEAGELDPRRWAAYARLAEH